MIYTASSGQLWIPQGSGISALQYYKAAFSVTNTRYGSGAYGYGAYGSTLASGTTPVWGVSTPSISLVRVDDTTFTPVANLASVTANTFFYDSAAQVLYIGSTNQYAILYPDMQSSPEWQSGSTYVRVSGVWQPSTVWVKVSGTWVRA